MIGKHSVMRNVDNKSEIYGAGQSFDGIHARGPAGRHSLTRSLVNILKDAVSAPPSSSSSSRNHNSASSCNPKAKVGTSSSKKHTPVFLNRGNIRDFYYSRNIFVTLQNVNISGN